ncbi:MAG: DUF4268 domain-containing protein [Alphaproteobacteria bacterium]|nr:DUF4268 domain-containing protein [Alphaproteobacteria bacterium]
MSALVIRQSKATGRQGFAQFLAFAIMNLETPVIPTAFSFGSEISNHKEQIEADLGEPISWQSNPQQKSCQIYFEKQIDNGLDMDAWDYFIEWMAIHFEKLEKSLKPHLPEAKKALDKHLR